MSGLPLVTGGTGFAGSHLIDQLTASRQSPAPCVAAWAHRASPAGDRNPLVAWSTVDLLDRNAVRSALESLRPSVIYHCAGAADVSTSWADPVTSLKVNTLGTHHLLEAVRHVTPRTLVVMTSSAAVYKSSADALSEDSPIGPASPYGVSKLGQEMVGSASETPVVVARSFNHAGPRQTAGYVTSSFARQIVSIEAGLTEPRLSVGNLDARRDITDVRDTVRAYRAMAVRGQAGRAYNVCSGRAYRIGDLLETMLSRASKAIQVVTDPARLRPSDQPLILGNPGRAEKELDWHATIPIEDTLQDILEFWRHHLATARG